MRIFIICPVRDADQQQKNRIVEYTKQLQEAGNEIYYPALDTDQDDSIGYRICKDNALAIKAADEIHIYWDKNSKGSLFDLGVAFAHGKPLKIINMDEVEITPTKSFSNMIIEWQNRTR